MLHLHQGDHDHADHVHEHEEFAEGSPERDMAVLAKLLSHWVDHNTEHAEGYAEWAHKAEHCGHEDVADEIEEAIELTKNANEALRRAAALMND